ncbi:MAG: BlaI/MecI/CopY family transcriptional regulator [Planctomycetota bacterium]
MAKQTKRQTSPEPTGERLPDAELEVLACLWQRGSATAREVREMMEPYRPMTHGAMVTLLKRLSAKGWVTREKGPVGKAFVYTPTRKAAPTQRRILADLTHRVFGGSGVAVMANLLDATSPSIEEIDTLQTMLDDLRAKRHKRQT